MPTREGQPCASTRPAHCIDRHPGGYLTAVYWLEKEHGERLRTGELGDHLDVSPASATEMAERLAADGFVDHVKHRGIELTERGATVGQELARRQCIVRTFFVSELDAELASTGDVGYVLSETGVERLRELVGHQREVCPPSNCRDRCLYGICVTASPS